MGEVQAQMGYQEHSFLRIPAELTKDMIPENCHPTRSEAIRCFHETKKTRVIGYPGLGCARWHGDTDAKALLQNKPRCERTKQCRTAVVDDVKVALGEPCWDFATLKTA